MVSSGSKKGQKDIHRLQVHKQILKGREEAEWYPQYGTSTCWDSTNRMDSKK